MFKPTETDEAITWQNSAVETKCICNFAGAGHLIRIATYYYANTLKRKLEGVRRLGGSLYTFNTSATGIGLGWIFKIRSNALLR